MEQNLLEFLQLLNSKEKLPFDVQYEPGANEIFLPQEIGREGDIGIDLYAYEDAFIPKGESRLIRTGVHIGLPPFFSILLKDRSSVSKYCHVLGGVMDQIYTGEYMVNMYCHSYKRYTEQIGENMSHTFSSGYKISKGDKICQGVITLDFNRFFKKNVVDKLKDTVRGDGKFGSTGS